MDQSLLQFCLKKGFLVDPEVLTLFKDIENPVSAQIFMESLAQHNSTRMITKQFFSNTSLIHEVFSRIPEEHKRSIEKLQIKLGLNIEISREIQTPISEVSSSSTKLDLVVKQTRAPIKVFCSPTNFNKKIEVSDFVKHYKNRFIEIKGVLQEHVELTNLVSINKISNNKQSLSIIGLVLEKKLTKNKNLILRVEDLTGTTSLLISANKLELLKKAEDVVLDSVLGFKCSGNKEILFVNDIIFPEAVLFERKHGPEENYAAFIGDLHVGTGLFMEDKFLRFIDYLNGVLPSQPSADKIKYLFIVGDLVCGVGIYPGQEKELIIKDLEGQFQKAAELLSKIRKDIQIVICPGNHDGVRIMEPQPLFDEKYAWPIYQLENVTLVTNPSRIVFGENGSFPGFNLLMYHGYSYHYYVDNVGHLRRAKATNSPEKIMAFLLKHRHMAPTHASTLYYPLEKDSLFIREVPDIFFSGHTHKGAVTYANNVLIISASTWESKTEFQEKMGNEPDFCKVPLFNLKTRAVHVLDFE